MKRFAFYGRVSTEDHQDPQSSRAWQLRRSQQLIEPAGGIIATEYFDIAMSRSLPWKRRPEAARLLAAFKNPDRGFDAVVIGEPQRAFYGNQFGLTFPVLVHYGIELWVPEVGGRVDPGSEAHDLVMMLFGGMSKEERSRIRARVRAAMSAQAATEGRFLGGRPPYGYRLADAGPHPNPEKASMGVRLHRLELDPVTSNVVVRIFLEYVAGKGLRVIAEGLTRDGIASPSAYDRKRNSHRTGEGWGKSAINAILQNPKYTGYMYWNRQRRDEVLIDIEDVAAGHESRMRWNGSEEWVRSERMTHPAIVTEDLFRRAQIQRTSQRPEQKPRKARENFHPYILRGILHCGFCTRRMQGTWLRSEATYRCSYPAEYALAQHVDHPLNVYLREKLVVPALDTWLSGLFDASHIDATCEKLMDAQTAALGDKTRLEIARRAIAECDRRLAKYRAALEAGTDPQVVAQWIKEVTTEKEAAEHQLRTLKLSQPITAHALRELIESLGDMLKLLHHVEPAEKAALYANFGIKLTHKAPEKLVLVEADLAACRANGRVGEGTWPESLPEVEDDIVL